MVASGLDKRHRIIVQRNDFFAEAKAAWSRNGWVRLPGFLAPAEIARLRRACDRALGAWEAETGGRPADATNMADLTEARYFEGVEGELAAILAFAADPRILDLLEEASGAPALFHNTQYFFEQPERSWAGAWHRDTQFMAADAETERARMASGAGAHFRVAFLADDRLEIVPGSHARWDDENELAIRRRGADAAMPGARRLALAPGDALLFHGWSIHRGDYGPRPRRTLDVIYDLNGPCEWAPPRPSCLRNPEILARLDALAQAFYRRFVAAYTPFWEAETR